MSAAVSVLAELRERGARVQIHNGRVRIEADAGSLPEHLIVLAREHRADLLGELQREVEEAPIPVNTISLVHEIFPGCRVVKPGDPLPDRLFEIESLPEPVSRQAGELALDRRDWTADDWLAVYLERAAVLEYVSGLHRREAEAIALAELGEQWAQHEIALEALGVVEPRGQR